jgi:hypothetical protein
MVRHGEDFAEDSLLGNHGIIRPVCPFLTRRWPVTGQVLVTFGRAFCNVATAQEALGRSLGSSLIVAIQRFLDQVNDYEVERKKLETRR